MDMHAFRTMLLRYLIDGCISSNDKLFSIIHPSLPFHKNADTILLAFYSLEKPDFIKNESFHIEPLITNNHDVLNIAEYIKLELHDIVISSLVHGSIGTDEEIPYSDFDGLLILKNSIFQSKKTLVQAAIKISKSFSLMFSYDNLQHHSWFILLEHELSAFPDYYFPRELLKYSKSLDGSINLMINKANYNFKSSGALENLVKSIHKKASSGKAPGNNYEIKNLFSEFMLLPTLFIQKVTGEGIYKKYSFEKAASYFSEEEWLPMKTVSQLRLNWNRPANKLPFTPPVIITSRLKKLLIKSSGNPTTEVQQFLNQGLIHKMNELAQTMLKKSNELQSV